jgi:hypothetical protein
MEKTVFLFNRHPDRSRENFAHHYIHNHAPLGARLTRSLRGYTVNIVETPGGPDAVTEHWLSSASDLLTPSIAYATQADFDAVVADDRTLFSDSILHVVVEETFPVGSKDPGVAPGTATPGFKLIWLYRSPDDAPPPPAGARRVVDNRVGYRLVFENGERRRIEPEYALIRMAWVDRPEDVGEIAKSALVTREYPFIDAPVWIAE